LALVDQGNRTGKGEFERRMLGKFERGKRVFLPLLIASEGVGELAAPEIKGGRTKGALSVVVNGGSGRMGDQEKSSVHCAEVFD